MSWTYDPTQLNESPLMQIRLILGDTDESDPLMQNEEIQFYIDSLGDVNRASIECIDAALARIASIPDYKLGPYQESTDNRVAYLNKRRAQLEEELTKYCPPLSEKPTTSPIFGYDMTSRYCDHTLGGGQTNEHPCH